MYDIGDVVRCTASITSVGGVYVDPTTLVFYVKSPDGITTDYTYGADPEVIKAGVGQYYIDVDLSEAGQWHYRYVSTTPNASGESSFHVGESFSAGVELAATTDLDYLIPALRMHLWDVSEPPAYSNDTLKQALLIGLKALMPRWNSRYIPSYNASTNNWGVSRNPNDKFKHTSPPVIMYMDERPIILAAAVAMNSGLIYQVAANAVSWRDEEVSFSNVTGARLKEESLIRDIEELSKLVPDRRKRLAVPVKGELIGFKWPPNIYEGDT